MPPQPPSLIAFIPRSSRRTSRQAARKAFSEEQRTTRRLVMQDEGLTSTVKRLSRTGNACMHHQTRPLRSLGGLPLKCSVEAVLAVTRLFSFSKKRKLCACFSWNRAPSSHPQSSITSDPLKTYINESYYKSQHPQSLSKII